VRRAIHENPGVRAVFVGDPSYVGTVGDVAGLANAAHEFDLPLVVDAAWAAHFGFHPGLPRHPLQLGADAMVTSAHKTLPAWSQAALVLAKADRIDPARLDAGVEASATTSPSGAVLASIDASRALLQRDGERLLGDAISATRAAKQRLARIEGLVVLDGQDIDPLKLTIVLAGTGADGNMIEQDLLAAGLPVESADRDVIIAIVSLADTAATLHAFTAAITEAIERRRGVPRPVVQAAAYSVEPRTAVPPRAAFFSPSRVTTLTDSLGRVCAELIAPYPPGIPVLAPGEQITRDSLGALTRAQDSGVRIAYAADPSLRTIRVIADQEGDR
jgi:arginine decarboxylase